MKNTKNLVKEVLDGNTNAFEELYQLTSKQVYFTCLSFVKNEQDALDLMQETYLSALTHLSALKEPERFAQWVSSIATNKCRNYLSKKSPLLLDEEVLDTLPANEDELTLPEHYITDREKRKILMDIMSEQLSVVQYQTILLYYFDGLSQQEIAKCMECPEGTVSYRLSVARNKIKEGVLSYEKKSGDKLYCVAGVPFLAAFFLAQAEEIIVPDVLSNILGAFTSTGVSAAEGVAQTAAENASQAVAKVTAEAAKQTAKKAGATAFTKSAVFKIGLGIAAISLLGAMVASVILIATISSKNSAASETIVTEADSNTNPDSASGSTENNTQIDISKADYSETADKQTEYVYESDNIAVEYISSSYTESSETNSNGSVHLTLNIINKCDRNILLDQVLFCLNNFSETTFVQNRELVPGENEVKIDFMLFQMKDNGPVEISSTDLILAFMENDNSGYVEKSYFTVNFSEPIAFNAVSRYPYDKCELVYSDGYLSFYSTCSYKEGEDSEFCYIVNNMTEHANFVYNAEGSSRYTYSSAFPNSYTPLMPGALQYMDSPDELVELLHFNVYDFMNSNNFNGSFISDTESFQYTVTKEK